MKLKELIQEASLEFNKGEVDSNFKDTLEEWLGELSEEIVSYKISSKNGNVIVVMKHKDEPLYDILRFFPSVDFKSIESTSGDGRLIIVKNKWHASVDLQNGTVNELIEFLLK